MSLWAHSYRPAVKSTPCGTSHNKREKMSSSRTLTCGRTDESWVWSDESKCASAFVISCGCRTPYDDIYRFLSIYCHLDVLLISESLIQTTCCFITTTQLRPGAERSCLRSRPDAQWKHLQTNTTKQALNCGAAVFLYPSKILNLNLKLLVSLVSKH